MNPFLPSEIARLVLGMYVLICVNLSMSRLRMSSNCSGKYNVWLKSYHQWSNYEGARGGLAPLKDRVALSKHLV